MPKVFVVNRGGHDFSKAIRFGEIVFLSEGEVNKYAVSQMYRMFASKIKDSSPDDFILITSLTSMCSIVCSMFARKHGRLNLLLYKDSDYIERKILLDELL